MACIISISISVYAVFSAEIFIREENCLDFSLGQSCTYEVPCSLASCSK